MPAGSSRLPAGVSHRDKHSGHTHRSAGGDSTWKFDLHAVDATPGRADGHRWPGRGMPRPKWRRWSSWPASSHISPTSRNGRWSTTGLTPMPLESGNSTGGPGKRVGNLHCGCRLMRSRHRSSAPFRGSSASGLQSGGNRNLYCTRPGQEAPPRGGYCTKRCIPGEGSTGPALCYFRPGGPCRYCWPPGDFGRSPARPPCLWSGPARVPIAARSYSNG